MRRWWRQTPPPPLHPDARRLLITADGGGSYSSSNRLWKLELEQLADEPGPAVSVAHFPRGTSKWNKIEHRMFCQITQNWRGRPLVSYRMIVKLIAATATGTGLTIRSDLDDNSYLLGVKVTDDQMECLAIRWDRSMASGTIPWSHRCNRNVLCAVESCGASIKMRLHVNQDDGGRWRCGTRRGWERLLDLHQGVQLGTYRTPLIGGWTYPSWRAGHIIARRCRAGEQGCPGGGDGGRPDADIRAGLPRLQLWVPTGVRGARHA